MDTVDTAPGQPAIEERFKALEKELASLRKQVGKPGDNNKVSLICFSGEWDKLFAGLTIAAGSLAMGMEVHMFFTFWSVAAFRKSGLVVPDSPDGLQAMFAKMLPQSPEKTKLSKFHFFGIGKYFMKKIMKRKRVDDIDVLFREVQEMGAYFHLCDTTNQLFGFRCKELAEGDDSCLDNCGVATFLSYAFKSKVALFI